MNPTPTKKEKRERFEKLNELYESLPHITNRRERYREAVKRYEKKYGEMHMMYEIFMGRRNMIKNKEVPLTTKTRTA